MREATGIRRHRLRALFVKGREREHSGADYLNCMPQVHHRVRSDFVISGTEAGADGGKIH